MQEQLPIFTHNHVAAATGTVSGTTDRVEPNLRVIGERIRESYDGIAARYRRDDEIEVTTPRHQRLHRILRLLSSGFGRPVQVLDAGCGTGRYFHCLRNVELLAGLDLSEEMLNIAAHPVLEEQITAERINLHRGNIHMVSFPPGSFDLIYSLGMFGHGCPVTASICDRFYEWLKPGGQLFFDVVDTATMSLPRRVKRSVRLGLEKHFPATTGLLNRNTEGVPFYGLSKTELENVMRSSRFSEDFSVTRHVCQSPLWKGVHLECAASKPGRNWQNPKKNLEPVTG